MSSPDDLQPAALRAWVQRDVLKNVADDAFVSGAGGSVFDVDAANFDEMISELERSLHEPGALRVIPFVSIQIAWRIQRSFPRLAQGLVFRPERLLFHRVATELGALMLNARYVLVTWQQLPELLPALRELVGGDLFVRPNTAHKAFTGFSGSVERVQREHAALSQTDGVTADELCVVAREAVLQPVEWRFWVVDGEPVTWAPYSWEASVPAGPPDRELLAFARTAAAKTEVIESALVMDIGTCAERGPRVLELNPLSTSGLYAGADLGALLDSLALVFGPLGA